MPTEAEIAAVDAVVIGAGIAGLTAAAELQAAGLRTTLIEASDQVGGLLRPTTIGGITVDAGAESFAIRNDSVAALIDDFGLDVEIVEPNPAGALLLSQAASGTTALSPLPRATVLGMPASPWAADVRASIGVLGALRASLDRVLPRGYAAEATTVGELSQRRLGDRVSSVLVDSICRSVYSTPAAELSVDAVAPRLREQLAATGSLTAAVAVLAQPTRSGSAVRGISGGLFRLATALASRFEASGGTILLDAPVRRIARQDGGWEVEVRGGRADGTVTARRLVVASTGPQAIALLDAAQGAMPDESAPLASPADFRDVTVAVARVRSSWLGSQPVGTGVIVAEGATRRAKALTHANAKWSWLDAELPNHEHILRLSFDGASPETVAAAGDRAVVAAEISHIIGVPVAQTDVLDLVAQPWRAAVVPADPQARAAQATRLAELAEADGPIVIGSWVSGTGLASVVPDARARARTIIES